MAPPKQSVWKYAIPHKNCSAWFNKLDLIKEIYVSLFTGKRPATLFFFFIEHESGNILR